MGRHKTYSIDCPKCGSPDRVLRKGRYKSKGEGFHRCKCHVCNVSFTRYIPEEADGKPMPPEAARKPVNQGERHPQSKLTARQVRDIIALKESGSKAEDLAEQFKVSKGAIVGILTGQTWGSVTGIAPPEKDRVRRYKLRGL